MIEIERKFLAKAKLLKIFAAARKEGKEDGVQNIDQRYLLSTKRAEIRLRACRECNTADYRLAVKLGNGFKRIELEYDIPAWLFFRLRPFTQGFFKTRFQVNGWNIDFFQGLLSGLVLAEYESSESPFVLPAVPEGLVLGPDVTEERTYANKNLARGNSQDQLQLVAEAKRRVAAVGSRMEEEANG